MCKKKVAQICGKLGRLAGGRLDALGGQLSTTSQGVGLDALDLDHLDHLEKLLTCSISAYCIECVANSDTFSAWSVWRRSRVCLRGIGFSFQIGSI